MAVGLREDDLKVQGFKGYGDECKVENESRGYEVACAGSAWSSPHLLEFMTVIRGTRSVRPLPAANPSAGTAAAASTGAALLGAAPEQHTAAALDPDCNYPPC